MLGGDNKKIDVVDLTRDSALDEGKSEEPSSLGVGDVSSSSGAEGVTAITPPLPPAKNETNNLVANITHLKQQHVSRSLVCCLVCLFCHVADMFASFLQKITEEIASLQRKCDCPWRIYTSNYPGYIHYHEKLNNAKAHRDEINVTLHVLKNLEFDANSAADEDLMSMPLPASKNSKTN